MKDQTPSELQAQLEKMARQLRLIRNLLIALIVGVVIGIVLLVNPATSVAEVCILILLYLIVPLAILYIIFSTVNAVYRRQKREQNEAVRFQELSGQ